MKNLIKHIVFVSLVLLTYVSSNGQSVQEFQVIKQDTFIAGEPVDLTFDMAYDSSQVLHCHSAFGSVVLNPNKSPSEQLLYKIPDFMAHKSGCISWYLGSGESADMDLRYKGKVYVLPNKAVESMETYLGPPDIIAGGKDYTMFVSIPTDEFDNPMVDSTQVNLDYYFKDNKRTQALYIENGMVYHRIYSPTKSGRLFVSSECYDVYSKEFDVNIQPALPVDFSISAEGHHYFADGNQILTLKTSMLTDSYMNVISDGTMVEFYIKNNRGDFLRTRGISQHGVAMAQIVHPEFKDTWQIQALVNGMAESDVIHVEFEQVVEAFDIEFLEQNRRLVIGPIKSYMNQKVPDGFKADFTLYRDGQLVKREIKEMHNGFVTFFIDPNEIVKGPYDMCFEIAGIRKTFQNIEL